MPWTTTVSIGILHEGEYPVSVQAPNGEYFRFSSLQVKRSSGVSAEDSTSTYINGALVDEDAPSSSAVLNVSGTYSVTCMFLESVEVIYEKDDEISVLPIKAMKKQDRLISIRSANGQSVSRIM